MHHISFKKMLTVTGIPSRHVYLQFEEMLSLVPPRDSKGRVFPETLVDNLRSLRDLLEDLEISLGEWNSWRQVLYLNHPNDAWNAPDWADPYWAKYYRKLAKNLKAATVDVHELSRWEWELKITYPRDAYGNIALDSNWCKYLRTVQESYAAGRNTYWCAQNLQSPAQRPDLVAVALGPEY